MDQYMPFNAHFAQYNSGDVYANTNTSVNIPDDILDMDENQYDNLVVEHLLHDMVPYLTKYVHTSDEQYNWVKNMYRWSSKKEYALAKDNDEINHQCIYIIITYLSKKIFNVSNSKGGDIIDEEILEEIIVSKKVSNFLLTDYIIIMMIQLYPPDKLEYYLCLILNHYNLQRVFADSHVCVKTVLSEYSLHILNIIMSSGIKLNFEELLVQYCRSKIDVTDKICFAIENLKPDGDNLSNCAIDAIFNSTWLETIMSKIDSRINFAALGSVYLMSHVNENTMKTLMKYGYDFKDMMQESANNKQNSYQINSKKTDQSKYLAKLLEETNFDKATLRQMLCDTIDYVRLVQPRRLHSTTIQK